MLVRLQELLYMSRNRYDFILAYRLINMINMGKISTVCISGYVFRWYFLHTFEFIMLNGYGNQGYANNISPLSFANAKKCLQTIGCCMKLGRV